LDLKSKQLSNAALPRISPPGEYVIYYQRVRAQLGLKLSTAEFAKVPGFFPEVVNFFPKPDLRT